MPTNPATAATHPSDNRRSPERLESYVLVVDDETVVREFLMRCLQRGGYRAKQAGTAGEALEMMVTEPAAAVLCDIRMPGEDGLWLASRLRTLWPGIPVVMASAIDDIDTIRQTRELGAVDYISKPIKPDQLIEVIRRALAREKSTVAPDDEESTEAAPSSDTQIDAEYTLEMPVRCPACGERINTLKAVRLIRVQVNFTSTLPRRGRVLACPHCLSIVPAELTNF
jgi:DNA-binding NtrC family response regulator